MSAKKIFSCCAGAIAIFAVQSLIAFGEEPKIPAPSLQKEIKSPEKKTAPTDPVAKVNGTSISRQELDRAVKVLIAQNRLPQPLPPEQQKEAENAALDQLIAAEILYQQGQKTEIKDIDKLITEKISQNRAKFQSPEEFDKALKSVEMSEKDLKEFTRKDIVITTFIEKNIIAGINVTDADAKTFYDENADKFKQEESVRASHILVGVDAKATDDDKKKAKEKAQGILKKIKSGDDFAALAKSDSTCPSSKQGGDLGSFGRGQMVGPFEDAAFALKVGEVSDVIETQFGYHIIKLIEKKEASSAKFEEVKPKIVEYLKNQKIQQGVTDSLEQLKAKSKIEKL